jgi:hypothetical protein
MTRISRNELAEIANTLVVANTPISLLMGLQRSAATEKLRQWTLEELTEYYDYLTARPRQTEIVVALAYAILGAIFLRGRTGDDTPIDPSRLHWGEQIRKFISMTAINTNISQTQQIIPAAQVSATRSTPSPLLYGPDERPLVRITND